MEEEVCPLEEFPVREVAAMIELMAVLKLIDRLLNMD